MSKPNLISKLLMFVWLLCPVASSRAEVAVRIHYQAIMSDKEGHPVTEPLQSEFSVWQGGSKEKVNSGKVLFREEVGLQPDSTGFVQYWLGNGSNVWGSLPPQQLGLEKALFVQLIQNEDGRPVARRFGLTPIDRAYVIQNMTFKSAGRPREYHPHFTTVSPDQVRRGEAVLFPDGRIQREDGSFLEVKNTKTSGVQELFDYCATGNVDGYIVGGSMPHAQQVIYGIKAPLRLHPAQGFTLETGSILLLFDKAIGKENGLTIDSCMMVNVFLRGLIVYGGTGYAVAIQPTGLLPLDTFVGPTIVDTEINITSLAGGGILFDGSVNFSRFAVSEINGGKFGVHVTANSSFSNNKFTCMHVHGQSETGLLIETGACNTWEINYNPDGLDPTPVVTGASDDLWFAAIGANTKPGLVMRPTASGNQFHLKALGGGFVNEAIRPSNRFYASPGAQANGLKLGFSTEQPAVGNPGVPVMNRNPFPVIVLILAPGSTSGWEITDVYQTRQLVPAPLVAGQSIQLMPGESIAVNYTGIRPTWVWRAVQ